MSGEQPGHPVRERGVRQPDRRETFVPLLRREVQARLEGGALVDRDGRRIEDLHGTQAFGHRNPHVQRALLDYLASDAPSWFPARVNPFAGRLARRLADLLVAREAGRGAEHALASETLELVEAVGGVPSEALRERVEAWLEELTGEIGAIEARVEELNQRFCAPDFYETTPADERRSLEAEHREANDRLRERMEAWEALENELAELPPPQESR